jgi:hypothetical protein
MYHTLIMETPIFEDTHYSARHFDAEGDKWAGAGIGVAVFRIDGNMRATHFYAESDNPIFLTALSVSLSDGWRVTYSESIVRSEASGVRADADATRAAIKDFDDLCALVEDGAYDGLLAKAVTDRRDSW